MTVDQYSQLVNAQYGRHHLGESILAALRAIGKDPGTSRKVASPISRASSTGLDCPVAGERGAGLARDIPGSQPRYGAGGQA
jgi:hypothetical protein